MLKFRFSIIAVLLFLLMGNNGYAQPTKAVRVVYDFIFQSDTTNPESKKKEQFALDVFTDHSKFVSLSKLQMEHYMDSLGKDIERQGGIQNLRTINMNVAGSAMNSRNFYDLYKMNTGKVKFQQRLMRDVYGYEEDMSNLPWEITDVTEKYSNYSCQKAKVNYAGRNWNALFTTDVPINNGPYKFSGLPGLIVKIWDDKNECVFELAEIKNVDNANSTIPKAELVKKAEFLKLEENTKVQMMAMANTMMNAGGNSNMTAMIRSIRDQNGNEIKLDDVVKKMVDAEKKNNNKLEKL